MISNQSKKSLIQSDLKSKSQIKTSDLKSRFAINLFEIIPITAAKRIKVLSKLGHFQISTLRATVYLTPIINLHVGQQSNEHRLRLFIIVNSPIICQRSIPCK